MPREWSDQEKALLEKARRISAEIAAPAAATVDAEARFPAETVAALREGKLLSAAVPRTFGGPQCGMSALAEMCRILGQGCSSSGMILAMHHIQVSVIARHAGSSPFFHAYLRKLERDQELVASVTSEVGTGGDMRSSRCAVEPAASGFSLDKEAPSVSYGAQADALLVTARRTPDSGANDQVLVLLRRPEYALEQTGEWNTLGMRGTCSPAFRLRSRFSSEQIMPEQFSVITERSMVPFSHVLWSACWLGIATDAVSKARAFVRAEARRRPGETPPGSLRAAEAAADLQLMRDSVQDSSRLCDDLMSRAGGGEELSSMAVMLRLNNLKISSSQLAVRIVTQALSVCGMAGYRIDSKFSLGRHLRDSHSAALMISNDRIYRTNASMLLVHKDE